MVPTTTEVIGNEKRSAKEDVEMVVLGEEEKDPLKAEIAKLRERWELASVINFMTVTILFLGYQRDCCCVFYFNFPFFLLCRYLSQ